MEKKRLCCDIDSNTYYILKTYCEQNNIKFSGLINVLLIYGIDRLLYEVKTK